ncbi:MAG: TerC family protein [Burkholderia sp.]
MFEFLATLNWAAVVQIVVIDLLLGGDNAVVIALACRNLPPNQRLRGVIWGTVGAIVLISFAVLLLDIPFLKLAGGLLLLWIGAKLIAPAEEGHDGIQEADRLWAAVRTIIVVDAVMSIDNVIAIAGAAERADPQHRLALVIFGLVVSIPVIVWGSTLVLKLLDRFPIIVILGAALLGWIGGGLIIGDPALDRWPQLDAPALVHGASIASALLVVAIGLWWKRRCAAAKAH